MKIIKKIGDLNFFNCLFFILSFSILSLTDSLYSSKGYQGGFFNIIKYIFLFLGLLVSFLIYCKKENNKRMYLKETFGIVFTVIIFGIVSLFLAVEANVSLHMETYMELAYIFISCIYAYLLVNTLDVSYLYKSCAIVLFFSIVNYVFFEKGISIFSLQNLINISFSDSYSIFESHYSSGVAFVLGCFFVYYNKNRFITITSILYVFLTFKRMLLLSVLFLFILSFIISSMEKKNKNRITNVLLSFAFVIATLYYFNYIKSNYTELSDFTMGRSNILHVLLNSDFHSTGFGSSTVFLNGKSIEMDLIRIFIEMGIIPLFVFAFTYWMYAGKNKYCICYMFFIFLNLLLSHSLGSIFTWVISFFTIALINNFPNKLHRKKFFGEVEL